MSNKVAVIIPTFNRGHLIGETVSSLLKQTRRPDEILIFNDGSTDDTLQSLSPFGSEISVVSHENRGKAATLNLALQQAVSDIIWICDDDDLLEPTACETLASTLEANEQLSFAAGRHMDFVISSDTGARQVRPPGHWRPSKQDEIFPDLLEGCHIFQPGLMVRKTAYAEAGPFNESLTRSQDYEMLLRLARRFTGNLTDQLVFLHREHDGARGSAEAQFSASQNADKWAQFNRIIFEPLLADLSDHEVFPKSVWDQMPEDHRPRAVLMKKACICARQRMWDTAIDYWSSAADSPNQMNLTDIETDLIARSTTSSLGADELLMDQDIQSAIKQLSQISRTGEAIVSNLKQSSRWMLKRAVLDLKLQEAVGAARFQLP